MKVRVGMIGGGYFGQFHINAWCRMDDVALIGVAEQSAERRDALAKTNPHITIYADSETLIAEAGTLDILDVTTPPQSHFAIIAPLLGQFPTIISQKPFCNSLEEAKQLTQMAKDSGTTLIVHENFRFMPWYRIFKGHIASGALGTIRQAQFRLRPGDGGSADAYLARQPYFRQMERFLVHETGIHWIDVFRFLFGEPESVFADLWRTNAVIAGEDSGLLLFRWPDGMRALFDGNRTLDHVSTNHRLTMGEFMVEGDKATLYLNGNGQITIRQHGSNQPNVVPYAVRDIDFGGDCVYLFQRHIIDHLTTGRPLETMAQDYLRNIEIENKVYQSAKEGKTLSILDNGNG